MRVLATVAAVAALAAVAVVVALGDDRDGSPRTGAVTMIGDSLNVGTESSLEAELRGWRIDTDDVVGRSSDAGIAALAARGDALAPVVVVSLGTNDPQDDVEGFRADVRDLLARAGPDRCVVWSTIWRDGANEGFNAVLADEADASGALRLVEWHAMAAAHPEWLVDGVHATPDGYAARAAAIAAVVRDCLPAGRGGG